MLKLSTTLALMLCLLAATANADPAPTRGTLLVATEKVDGSSFAKTVILMLHHDDSGSLGVVINRPIDVSAMATRELREDYLKFRHSFYWGGPVATRSMRALLRTDSPPDNAQQIVDSVYLVEIGADLLTSEADASSLRFFAGYAGWGAGQLPYELATGSWRVVIASEAIVFAEDAAGVWQRLFRTEEYRVEERRTDLLFAALK